jgi:hypothetical protein
MSLQEKIKAGTLKVEKNVPIPPNWGEGGYVTQFLKKLKIGDSFLIDGYRDAEKIRCKVKLLRNDASVTVRKNKDKYRVWLIPKTDNK